MGLEDFNVKTPSKRNEHRYKTNPEESKLQNKKLSTKRIKVEHVFAYIKTYRILQRANYYKTKTIEIFFKAIANIYNLDKILK